MRGVIAHPPSASPRELRQVLLGSGLDCEAADIVPWNSLATRLGQQDADVVVAVMEGAVDTDWLHIEQAKQLTTAPLVVVGPAGDPGLHHRARMVGASGVVDSPQIREGLDRVVEQVAEQQKQQRGVVISVYAPMTGSGGTTVAMNLASGLNQLYQSGGTGLIELASEFGDLAMLMDVEPTHTAEEVCQRWKVLDAISLRGSLQPHRTGLRVLVNSPERPLNEHMSVEAVRRVAVLARVAFDQTVLALDGRLGDCEFEALKLSDRILLVVRPDVPSVKRAHLAMLQAIEAGVPQEKFQLLVNRANMRGALKRRDIEAALNLPVMHRVPEDTRACTRAANRGELVRERSAMRSINRHFARLARLVG